MPKQSRGFWVCSLCSQAFDQFEEASYHETESCPLRYSSQPAGDQSSWQQYPIQSEPFVMPPLSNVNIATPAGHRREPSSASFSFDIKPEPRIALLLGPNDSCTLETSDAIACKSIELFETSEFSESGRLLTQVGLRCSYCSSPSSETFPQSTNHIGDCVRQIAEQHLTGCRSFPQESRDLIKRSVKKRQQIRKGGEPIESEDKKNLKLLTEFCSNRCKKLFVIDRIPKNSGIMLETVSGSTPHSQMIIRASPLSPSVPRRSSPLQEELFRTTQLHSDRPMPPYHQSTYHQFETTNEQMPLPSYHAFVPGYVVPPDFPFLQERGGEWVCKFCNHLHPAMRDPKFYWMAPDRSPPPHDFIDYHLSACRAFQESQYNAFEYQANFSGQPVNVYGPTRWETPFEDDQQMLASGVDPRIPYESAHSELSQFEGSPYNRLPPPMSNTYPADSPQSRRYGTPVAQNSRTEPPESNEEYSRALEFLSAAANDTSTSGGQSQSESSLLVVGEDKLLLTDYFYYIMKQLCPVRFSEADRRTRGGKRENIAVGYGGLQCIHCADLPNTRKFFWSNVDRLANSFAEIPSHVLKCRRCPQPTKDALLLLKQRHPDQMSRLPRGSQKVFFRRMWRRLHDEDPPQDDEGVSLVVSSTSPPETRSSSFNTVKPIRPNPVETGSSLIDNSPAGTSGSEESTIMLQRSTVEAAKALADAAIQTGPPSPFSRVLLAVPEDQKWLSDTDCFIRRQLEVFCSTRDDVDNARNDRKYPVREGQVGIRCIHCALSKNGARGQAVAYPFNISGIYEAAREFQRLHLESCENLPLAAKAKLEKLKGSSSLSSVLRKYYILAANAIGLVDTRDGIRAGGESIPIGSQAAFAFSEEASPRPLDDTLLKGDSASPRDIVFEREKATRKRAFDDEESSGDGKPPARSKEKHGV